MFPFLGRASRQLGIVLIGLGLIVAIAGTISEVEAQSKTGSCAPKGTNTCPINCSKCQKGTQCYLTAQYCSFRGNPKGCVSPNLPNSTCDDSMPMPCGSVTYCYNNAPFTNPTTKKPYQCDQTVPYCTGVN